MAQERFAWTLEHRFLVQILDLAARPWRFTEKRKRAVNARIVLEAIDMDAARKFVPSVFFDQFFKYHLQGNAVQRVVGMRTLRRIDLWHMLSRVGSCG